ncbi:MAG: hypothetical protein ACQETE_14395 [Bacteroidota bacterium]
MNRFLSYFFLIFLLTTPSTLFAQDSLLTSLLLEHHRTIQFDGTSFSGPGWQDIQTKVQNASQVLIGEDHFIQEIPVFTEAIMNSASFDNLIIELDPYSTELIERSLTEYSVEKRARFRASYQPLYSFYALQSEYSLLQSATHQGVNLIGAEQIIKWADRFVLQDLAKMTQNQRAQQIYHQMIDSSAVHFKRFKQDPETTFYMETPHFKHQLDSLKSLELSPRETAIIEDLALSRNIYDKNAHHQRIQLIKRTLLDNFNQWHDHKNLFKYGAVHMPGGESLLGGYDVGNLVTHVADAQFNDSFHVMIFAEDGEQGTPFAHLPSQEINSTQGLLSKMAPFFEATDTTHWSAFNTAPIQTAIQNEKLSINDPLLKRIIQGYDMVIIIPEATASIIK